MFDEMCAIICELSPSISAAMRHYMDTLLERKSTDDPYPLDSPALIDWRDRMLSAYHDLSPAERRIDQEANDLLIARKIEQEDKDQERG